MTSQDNQTRASVADEAARYLETVDLFASLDADPHADARARAAFARATEALKRHTRRSGRKGALRWRS